MSLRVDLILPTEQRSASVLSLKSIIRIVTIAVPATIAVFIAMAAANFFRISGEVKRLEGEWKTAQPRKEAATKLRKEVGDNLDLKTKIQGWKASQFDFGRQLVALQTTVTPELKLQLKRLSYSTAMTVVDKNVPARTISLTLNGNAYGDDSEYHVQLFVREFRKHPDIVGATIGDNIKVTRFDALVGPGAGPSDRSFTITVPYHPRKLK